MVDFEYGGDPKQDQEPEVDHGVHDPGTRFAHQRLHVDASPEVGAATFDVA
jgi:hypothetical protein